MVLSGHTPWTQKKRIMTAEIESSFTQFPSFCHFFPKTFFLKPVLDSLSVLYTIIKRFSKPKYYEANLIMDAVTQIIK